MAHGSTSQLSSTQTTAVLKKVLRNDSILVTMKFGFLQKPYKYSVNDGSNSIIEKLYRDAESWLRSIALGCKNLPMIERYTLYLFRIPTNDLAMIPIAQLSDIEQNSLIELVIVPVEINQNPHTLYRCQLNMPTNCSKCSRLITGVYRQGFRCRKCRMIYHKDCAPFLLDDCSIKLDSPVSTQKTGSNTNQPYQPSFVNPFVCAPATSSGTTVDSIDNTIVPIYSLSTNNSKFNEQTSVAISIIDEGIFPACVQGTHIYRRYLFLLTSTTLKLTTDLVSMLSSQQQQVNSSSDVEIILPLAEIINVVLTHFVDGRDHIFEIHFQGEFILCVGKKSDSDDLQMQTAQFYSSMRDQCEALKNVSEETSSIVTVAATCRNKTDGYSMRKTSVYRRPPCGLDNEDKDLHELYEFTGEKIGKGNGRKMIDEINNVHVFLSRLAQVNLDVSLALFENQQIGKLL
jgi:hypothetical protein